MAQHRLKAEPEVYGAAAFLMIVHMYRNLAGRDARSRKMWSQVLEHAAKDAEKVDNDFGHQTAMLIRSVMVMSPLLDPRQKRN
ncbi:MAG: hypothetical protein KIT16_22970 [Rhodospirillaceae bacterium]|nr:hypothetical protein [Rhodospirillaceae bacterium]